MSESVEGVTCDSDSTRSGVIPGIPDAAATLAASSGARAMLACVVRKRLGSPDDGSTFVIALTIDGGLTRTCAEARYRGDWSRESANAATAAATGGRMTTHFRRRRIAR